MCDGHIFFGADKMIADSKLYSKKLLEKSTVGLFCISLLSLILRTVLFAAVAVFSYFFFKSDFLKSFSMQNGKYFAAFLLLFVLNTARIAALLVASAIKLGESFIYLKRALGEKGSFSLLFHFLTPKKSARAFSLYCTVGFYNTLWLIFFLVPPAMCAYTSAVLYKNAALTVEAFYALAAGTAALTVFALCFHRAARFRYEGAPYYMCLQGLSAGKAVKKSIRFTDKALKKSVLFKIGFSGWFASCLTVLPVVYVVPYYKLSKARFIINTVTYNRIPEENRTYPITLFPYSPPQSQNPV